MIDYDLTLKNGHLIDPAAGIDAPHDLSFRDGALVAMDAPGNARETRDLTGCIVTPGLIDLHSHVYWGGTSLGIDPDAYGRASAVATCIDTGSAGPGNFAGFRAHVIERSDIRVLAYLHVSHAGIYGFSKRVMMGESEDIRLMDPITAVEVARANQDVIIGIKIRLGRIASGHQGMTPFAYALQVAEATQLPLMVHIDEPPPSYDEVVAALRPGDVLTHCFRPFPNTPLDGAGKVRASVIEARARGVIFDIGHGKGSFSFEVARRMLAEGFAPDCISSDVHALCVDGPAFDQVTTMSKLLCLGMPLADVIRASTEAPARAINRGELGTLSVGKLADVSVLRLLDGPHEYKDATGAVLRGQKRLTAAGLVRAGRWWHGDIPATIG